MLQRMPAGAFCIVSIDSPFGTLGSLRAEGEADLTGSVKL